MLHKNARFTKVSRFGYSIEEAIRQAMEPDKNRQSTENRRKSFNFTRKTSPLPAALFPLKSIVHLWLSTTPP